MENKNKVKELYNGDYCSLFDDYTMGFSDGVGFLGTIDRREVKKLYKALKKLFNKKNKNRHSQKEN